MKKKIIEQLEQRMEQDSKLQRKIRNVVEEVESKRVAGKKMTYIHRKTLYESKLRDRLFQQLKEVIYRDAVSYRVLAEKAGVAPSLISDIAREIKKPSVGILLHLLDCLGWEMRYEFFKKPS